MIRRLLLGISIFGAVALLTLVYLQKYKGLLSADETSLGAPLAVLREIKNNVRYKNAGDIFWQNGKDGQKLYNMSEVFVDEASRATLYFSGSRRARLSANTLLKLSVDSNDSKSLVLALNDGSFNLKNGASDVSGFVLKVDEAGLKVGTDLRFDLFVKKREGGLGLAVASGQLGIGGVQEKQELKQGESIVIKERAQLNSIGLAASEKVEFYIEQTVDHTVKLLHPTDNQIVYKTKRPQIFQWSGGSTERSVLQISSSPDFYDFKEIDVTGANVYTIPEDLHGEVFWRIVSVYKGLPQYSTAGFFKVANINEVMVENVTQKFISKGKWQLSASVKEEEPQKYEFQLSRTTDFAETYDGYVGNQPFQSMVDISGSLFIRVRRIYDSGLMSPWSPPKNVVIREPLAPPVLKIESEIESPQGEVTAKVIWENVPNATVFVVHQSKFPDFASFQSQIVQGKNELFVNHAQAYPLYFRVLAQSQEGELSPASNSVLVRASKLISQKLASAVKSAPKAAKAEADAAPAPVVNLPIALSEPLDKAIFYQGQSLAFKWQGTADTLQISRVSNFSQDIKSYPVVGKNMAEVQWPDTGSYYWRVIQKSQKPVGGRYFSVLPKTDTLIEKIDLRFVQRGSWKLVPKVQGAKAGEIFRMQVSRTADFAKQAETLAALSEGIPASESGDYFIRVKRTSDGKDISKWSNTVSQFIRPPLDTPVLGKDEEVLASPTYINLKVSWSEVKNATSYILEVDDTPVFGDVQKKINVPATSYTVAHASLEPAYLRVTARSAEGELSQSSKVFKIKGLVPGPKVDRYEVTYGKLDVAGDSDKLHIMWSHRKNAKKYVVEVGRKEDLSDAQKFETVNIEFFRPVQVEGWYYFRLRPLSGSTEFFEAPSQVYGIEYRKEKGLLAAALEEPGTGEVFKSGDVHFSWGQVLGAAWYELELSRSPQFKDSNLHKIEAREYSMRQPMDKGRWYYRIRGRSPTQTSPWSDSTYFEVK